MVLFSVIVPLYNTEKYIGNCLKSMIRQTFENFECIIIDDGSTDASYQVASNCIQHDKRFVILKQENQGQSLARNHGIQKASGEYLVFLDSDDFIQEDGLEKLAEIINNARPDIIMSNTFAYYEEENKSKLRVLLDYDIKAEGDALFKLCIGSRNFYFAPWAFTVKRSFYLEKNLWFEPGLLHEDELWVPKLMLECAEIYFYSEGIYYNRCNRTNSTTQSANIKKLIDKLKIIELLQDYGKAKQKKEQKMLNIRCAQLMAGIIKESSKYINDNAYKELYKNLIQKLTLIKEAGGKYNLLYIGCSFFGISNLSRIWNKIK